MRVLLVSIVVIAASVSAQAKDRVVQVFKCKNATMSAVVTVRADIKTSVATVEWSVRTKNARTIINMGYMFVTKGLEKFDSLDTDERMEMDGKTLILSVDSVPGQEQVLTCR